MIPFLPDFPKILGVPIEDASWLITATLMTNVVATPSVAKLADMFGKRKVMLVCVLVMILGSILGTQTESLSVLIIARVMQGFAIGLVPIGISIMRDELPKEKLAAGVAIMSGALGIGWAIGLPLGGMISAFFSWQSVFWISLGLGIAIFIAVLIVIPKSPIRTGGRFDFFGAALLSICLTALLLVISKGNAWGLSSSNTLLSLLVFACIFPIWISWELKQSEPLIDIRLSRQRTVLLTNISAYFVGFGIYINMLGTVEFLQEPTRSGYGLNLTEFQAGLAMVPIALAMPVIAPVSVKFMKLIGPRQTLIIGTLIMAVGYIAHLVFASSPLQVVLCAVVVSAGTAVAYAPMPILIMGAVPIDETASANGVNAVVRSIGTSSASAMVAAVLAGITVVIGDQEFPQMRAFQLLFMVSAIGALIGCLSSYFLPKRFSK